MLIPPIFGVLGLVMAYVIYGMVMKYPGGEDKVAKIGEQIHIGAMVFMKREYQMLSIFAGVLIVVLWVLLGWKTAFAFIVGALASGTAGYIGMFTATKANVRTTTAAHTKGAAEALTVAFFGGSIMGLAVASLGLFGLGILYLVFGGDRGLRHGRLVGRAVRACRRRHLHQVGRRGRRPGRQDRGGHPRGRPPQPGRHRGQCR
jgi:K(+)-stimulated pyrophosphate-energized sodium pump